MAGVGVVSVSIHGARHGEVLLRVWLSLRVERLKSAVLEVA